MDNYSPWAKIDPNMKQTYQGTDGTEGFVSAWSSTHKDVGVGEQEIEKIVEGESIDFKLRFFEPFKSDDHGYLLTSAITENQTKVTWGSDGHMDYPFNALILIMNFEKTIGEDFSKGLSNLKQILENK
nr:SRPBCC family protein [Aquimarina agarivorans]